MGRELHVSNIENDVRVVRTEEHSFADFVPKEIVFVEHITGTANFQLEVCSLKRLLDLLEGPPICAYILNTKTKHRLKTVARGADASIVIRSTLKRKLIAKPF